MEFIIDNEVIKGHDKYLLIMNLISNPGVDVSTNQDFQRAYSGYYFPAQVKQSFKDFYFKYMQECRSSHPSFGEVLQHIYTHTGDVHYSFASKLLHTLDPDSPVLDRHVLRVLGFQRMDGQYIRLTIRPSREKRMPMPQNGLLITVRFSMLWYRNTANTKTSHSCKKQLPGLMLCLLFTKLSRTPKRLICCCSDCEMKGAFLSSIISTNFSNYRSPSSI